MVEVMVSCVLFRFVVNVVVFFLLSIMILLFLCSVFSELKLWLVVICWLVMVVSWVLKVGGVVFGLDMLVFSLVRMF